MKTIAIITLSTIMNLVFCLSSQFSRIAFHKDNIDTTGVYDSEICLQNISFENHVKIILQENCTVAGCHGANGPMKGDFTTYESVVQYAKSGDGFWKRIFESKDMPPIYSPANTSLSADQLKTIECWIDQGYAK